MPFYFQQENTYFIGRTVRDKSFFRSYFFLLAGFPCGLSVKKPSATQETQVRSLGQEDPLKKEMAIHPVFLSRKSNGQRSLVGYSPWGLKKSGTTECAQVL